MPSLTQHIHKTRHLALLSGFLGITILSIAWVSLNIPGIIFGWMFTFACIHLYFAYNFWRVYRNLYKLQALADQNPQVFNNTKYMYTILKRGTLYFDWIIRKEYLS